MRRMYSKEQLQKLIDEVSRLIAIEELDKVVPVPSLAKAGYIMQVNSTGTGYQLKNIDELQVPLYWHGLQMGLENSALQFWTCTIINNSSEKINTLAKFIAWAEAITGQVDVPVNGVITIDNVTYPIILVRKLSNGTWAIVYNKMNNQGFQYIGNVDLSDYIDKVDDSTNKLN